VGAPPFCSGTSLLGPSKNMVRSAYFAGFDSHQEHWQTYIARFEIFCSVTDVPDDKKAITLLNAMEPKTFNLLLNVAAPKKPNELSYADIVKLLTQHFDPAPLIIAELSNSTGGIRNGVNPSPNISRS